MQVAQGRSYEFYVKEEKEAKEWTRALRLILGMQRLGLPLKQVNPYDYEHYMRITKQQNRAGSSSR